MRSFLGSFKQFSECVEGYADLLHQLEKVCGGRKAAERIVWTEELKKVFDKARLATREVKGVHTPRPTDTIHTYSDYSQAARAVGGRMVIVRKEDGKEKQLHGGYFSVVLDEFKGRWIPCEAEAAGVRLTLEHFAPYIRESLNQAVHFTDNLPVVQAYKRSLTGAFSNSSRIATFLTSISTICSDIVHKPGKTLHSADFQSRHPTGCEDPAQCQICQFARSVQKKGDEASKIRALSIQDVLDGTVALPFIQRKAWLVSQHQDKVHIDLRRLIQSGQQPEKRSTGGPATKLKLLYNLYRSGDLKVDKDGLVMAKAKDGYFAGWVISVPSQLMPGIANAIHIKLGHPSKSQQMALMARYFYSPGHAAVIQAVADACLHCRSLKPLPRAFSQDSTEKVDTVGTAFAVDVMERHGQKIFVAREKFSQYTRLELLRDQTADSLRTAIIKTVLPWAHRDGATIRCDGATALQSLAAESDVPGSLLHTYKLKIEIGRLTNPNKNAVAENAIKEVQKEILKHKPDQKQLSEEDLIIVERITNERIRNRGLAAKEILTCRDILTNKPKTIKDEFISQEQYDKRVDSHLRKSEGRKHEQEDFHVGDLVMIKNQLSKLEQRHTYIITGFINDMIEIQKIHTQFRAKKSLVYPSEIMKASSASEETRKQLEVEYPNDDLKNENDEEHRQHMDKTKVTPSSCSDQVTPLDTGTLRKRGRPRGPSKPLTDQQESSRPTRFPRQAKSDAQTKLRVSARISQTKLSTLRPKSLAEYKYRLASSNKVIPTLSIDPNHSEDPDTEWVSYVDVYPVRETQDHEHLPFLQEEDVLGLTPLQAARKQEEREEDTARLFNLLPASQLQVGVVVHQAAHVVHRPQGGGEDDNIPNTDQHPPRSILKKSGRPRTRSAVKTPEKTVGIKQPECSDEVKLNSVQNLDLVLDTVNIDSPNGGSLDLGQNNPFRRLRERESIQYRVFHNEGKKVLRK